MVDAPYLEILDLPLFIVNKFERVWRQSWGTTEEGGQGQSPAGVGLGGRVQCMDPVQAPPGNRLTRLKTLPLSLRWRSVKVGRSQKLRVQSMV